MKKRIYMVPWPGYPTGRRFYSFVRKAVGSLWDDIREELSRQGYRLICTSIDRIPKNASLAILHNLHETKDGLKHLETLPKERRVLFLWEPPNVLPYGHLPQGRDLFSKVYTYRDDFVDGGKYKKFHYFSSLAMIRQPVPFADKKLLTIFCGNRGSSHPQQLYSERRKAIDFFDSYPNSFDFYGPGWEWEGYKTYKGRVKDKIERLSQYRFALAYENIEGIPGWITEKIFDCFLARTIPIYKGAPNIAEYIPKNCFLSRDDFTDEGELFKALQSMTEMEYQGYLDRAEVFIQSRGAQRFSKEAFAKQFVELCTTV